MIRFLFEFLLFKDKSHAKHIIIIYNLFKEYINPLRFNHQKMDFGKIYLHQNSKIVKGVNIFALYFVVSFKRILDDLFVMKIHLV